MSAGASAGTAGNRAADTGTAGASAQGSVLPLGAGDALVLLAPRPEDAEAMRRALAAGRHLLVTPQPWLSPALLDDLASEAQRAGVELAVLHPERFLPSRQLMRQELDAGHLGAPGLVRIHRWTPAPTTTAGAPPAEPLAPASARSPAPAPTSATTPDALPVPLPMAWDVDVALWLMGAPPDLVFAVERPETADHKDGVEPASAGDTGDTGDGAGRLIALHLGFPGGGMALIDFAATLPPGDGYQSLSLIGSSGAAYADDHHNVQLLFRGGHPAAVRAGEGERASLALVQAFAAAVHAGESLAHTVASWRAVLAVAYAAERSLASRQAVSLEAP